MYSRNVAQRLVLISQEIDDLRAAAASFATHVKSVYEMEMFYGDQTLQSLMDHARSFREYMDEFDLSTYQRKKMQMPRRPKSKKSNHYFTKDHENAIIDYCSTDCNKKKTQIYVKMLQPAFSEMVDKIVFTYKFTTLPNIDILRDECKIWLMTILDKFHPEKGHKAFSYFSVITKNWFIHKVKKQKRKNMREVDYDAAPRDMNKSTCDRTNLGNRPATERVLDFLL